MQPPPLSAPTRCSTIFRMRIACVPSVNTGCQRINFLPSRRVVSVSYCLHNVCDVFVAHFLLCRLVSSALGAAGSPQTNINRVTGVQQTGEIVYGERRQPHAVQWFRKLTTFLEHLHCTIVILLFHYTKHTDTCLQT